MVGDLTGRSLPRQFLFLPGLTYLYLQKVINLQFFGTNSSFTSSAASINGDDAIELFQNGSVVDVYGDINVDGSGQIWDYLDGWAYRNVGAQPNGGIWDASGMDIQRYKCFRWRIIKIDGGNTISNRIIYLIRV